MDSDVVQPFKDFPDLMNLILDILAEGAVRNCHSTRTTPCL